MTLRFNDEEREHHATMILSELQAPMQPMPTVCGSGTHRVTFLRPSSESVAASSEAE